MEKTKEEILTPYVYTEQWGFIDVVSLANAKKAMQEYADQEKEKEALAFADFLVKNYQPRFPNKSDWVKILDSNKFKKIYTTTELYQIFKKEQHGK